MVEERWVERRGSERFRPQSPREWADAGVEMACWTGYGRVAVEDCGLEMKVFEGMNSGGLERGCGREKKREERSALAVGEKRFEDMVVFLLSLSQRHNGRM